jgi:hypothetical protein
LETLLEESSDSSDNTLYRGTVSFGEDQASGITSPILRNFVSSAGVLKNGWVSLGDEYNSPTHIIDSLRTNTRIDNLHNGGVGNDNYLISFSWGTMVETVQVTTTITTLDIS